ncbi:GH-E family nuclease [Porphyromonas macacae]|uniref:GH-E family nuclease n=1 Tax=Porphyromonas macacae TaxID=28115 RepID=UPI0009DCB756|nr:GH-E family nuclease [Porphyromonas macacae]
MGHIHDAVTYWNETGRYLGVKSKEVRKWMLDSDNYILEYFSTNRSKGAKSGKTATY